MSVGAGSAHFPPGSGQMAVISLESLAQARYALFEKLIKSKESLATAVEVFPAASTNVQFWRGEVSRVGKALQEFGEAP